MNDRSWTRSYFGRTWTECTVFCLMNIIVNAFILAFVNGAFSQFNFIQDSARFPSSPPGENWLKHTVNALICSRKTPNLTVVYKKRCWTRGLCNSFYFRSKRNFSTVIQTETAAYQTCSEALPNKHKWIHICFFYCDVSKRFLSDVVGSHFFDAANSVYFLTLKHFICSVYPEDNALEHMRNFVILCKMFYSQKKNLLNHSLNLLLFSWNWALC